VAGRRISGELPDPDQIAGINRHVDDRQRAMGHYDQNFIAVPSGVPAGRAAR
jgi:hypothetical protein